MSNANTKKSKATKVSPPSGPGTKGYKGHVAGSRKATIHELYDREGAGTAWTRGLKMKLKEGTLRSWFGQWQRTSPKRTPAGKKPAVPMAKAEKNKAIIAAKPVAELEPAAVIAA